MTNKIPPQQADAISRISGLVLVNAMIFQEILAYHDDRVDSLEKTLDEPNLLRSFSAHWRFILEDINYYPIFYLARDIIINLTADADIIAALKNLADTAQRIVSMRAALRHDLMGRVYHRLLADKKYLGTYYTKIPPANLLLKLALDYDNFPVTWHDLDQISQLRIADLACGTGTLLMAAADAIADNYLRASAEHGLVPELDGLQKRLVEEIIHGYDVLPSAIHLTASTLALRAPQIAFEKMNLFSLPMGGPAIRLGSIDFLDGKRVAVHRDLFGADVEARQMGGKGAKKVSTNLPDLDLCVMNPPFTRSVGGNLLFGSLPEADRKKAQEKLKRVVRRRELQASITAGLGSVFVAVADRYIKPGGRIALVLPKALLSGVAWELTREILRTKYRLEYLVASHDPLQWNFSESTDLSEVLLVARKEDPRKPLPPSSTVALNLWRNPATNFDALAVCQTLRTHTPPNIPTGQGALDVFVGTEKFGEAISYPWEDLKAWGSWIMPCAFAQSELLRVAYDLLRGQLYLPGYGQVGKVALCPLHTFATLGPDRRDIHDGFTVGSQLTPYPAFWGHEAKEVFSIAQTPNAYLSPLPEAKPGRNLRLAQELWPLAGNILMAERMWLKTQGLVALRVSERVLSNMWWPVSLKGQFAHQSFEKALALWLNSTFGLILLLANRQETRGAWVDFKKPVLNEAPVIDLRTFSANAMETLATTYDAVCDQGLRPFSEMDADPVREKIDTAIGQVLGLPDIAVLRRLLAREPVVCLQRL